MKPVAYAFGQARIQARHGRRPGPESWRRLDAIGDFAHYVQAVHATGLEPWVTHIGPTTGAHQIEIAMRERWRGQVHEAAQWAPRAWRPAVRHISALVDLPAVQHLLEGKPAPAWIGRDPLLAPAATDDPAARHAALRAAPGLRAVADAWRQGVDPATAWDRQWHASWQAVSRSERAGLREVEHQARELSATQHSPGDGGHPGLALGRALEPEEHRAVRIVHQRALTPAAVFAYLLLVWMDFLRLRAGLVRRRLLPAAG